MDNEGRIVELQAEMLIKQDAAVTELKLLKEEVVKLNLQSGENTRAILKIADRVEKIADLEARVSKLEKTVYK
jgi:hypothetical protein